MELILQNIQLGEWEKALSSLLDYLKDNPPSVDIYVLGATIMEHFSETDTMYDMIISGLSINPTNYELYVLLGDYYDICGSYDQAYLSYENALFLCKKSPEHNDHDLEQINNILSNYKLQNNINVNNVSIIILSYNTFEFTKYCIESIRAYCYKNSYEIIVIDNASTDGSVEWLRNQSDIILIENPQNLGFPAACNQGIAAASPSNDIFLLNNDTLLMHNSLYLLRMGLYNDALTAATGAVTNHAGNGQQIQCECETIEDYYKYATINNIPKNDQYETKSILIMFAMLVKRQVVNQIGLLDERFTPGNYEDNDYGFRIMEHGYTCVLCHNCFIYHFGSQSFGKAPNSFNNLLIINREKFHEKWNVYSDSCIHPHTDIIDILDISSSSQFNILAIDCELGDTLTRIKYLNPNANLYAIESNHIFSKLGSSKKDIVYTDYKTLNTTNIRFDYIILIQPYSADKLRSILPFLKTLTLPNCHIVLSLSQFNESVQLLLSSNIHIDRAFSVGSQNGLPIVSEIPLSSFHKSTDNYHHILIESIMH